MRGFWYMIEAVLISTILMSFLIIVGSEYNSMIRPDNLAEKGYLILRALDNRGELRNYTTAMDDAGLNSLIPEYGYNHTIQICNYEGTCVGNKPYADNIWTANYIISGEDVFKPFTIALYFSIS